MRLSHEMVSEPCGGGESSHPYSLPDDRQQTTKNASAH